jgi:hypothetical protein
MLYVTWPFWRGHVVIRNAAVMMEPPYLQVVGNCSGHLCNYVGMADM